MARAWSSLAAGMAETTLIEMIVTPYVDAILLAALACVRACHAAANRRGSVDRWRRAHAGMRIARNRPSACLAAGQLASQRTVVDAAL